jgi:ribonuclease BN (tRNA processing enzyme)
MCNFVRTIIPIGQGAFYCEKFCIRNKSLNVVYDCGTLSSKINLYTEIDNLFAVGEQIDLLFVSHFDSDHVNGIKYLCEKHKVKKIVLPEITDNLWYLYTLSTYKKDKSIATFANFIDSHRNMLIEVRPYNNEQDVEGDEFFINDFGPTHKINSGDRLRSDNKSAHNPYFNWGYIPINFSIAKEKLEDLKKAILSRTKDKGINEINDLNNADKVANVTKEINKAFKDAKINLNESSLVVYSGPIKLFKGRPYIYYPLRYHYIIKGDNMCAYPYFMHCGGRLACLFTGDALMNKDRCDSTIRVIKDLKEYIGVLQIPHHGSANNFSAKVFETEFGISLCNICSFISYGIKNRFRHPSSKVILDLFQHHNTFLGVTEEKESQFYEIIDID